MLSPCIVPPPRPANPPIPAPPSPQLRPRPWPHGPRGRSGANERAAGPQGPEGPPPDGPHPGCPRVQGRPRTHGAIRRPVGRGLARLGAHPPRRRQSAPPPLFCQRILTGQPPSRPPAPPNHCQTPPPPPPTCRWCCFFSHFRWAILMGSGCASPSFHIFGFLSKKGQACHHISVDLIQKKDIFYLSCPLLFVCIYAFLGQTGLCFFSYFLSLIIDVYVYTPHLLANTGCETATWNPGLRNDYIRRCRHP